MLPDMASSHQHTHTTSCGQLPLPPNPLSFLLASPFYWCPHKGNWKMVNPLISSQNNLQQTFVLHYQSLFHKERNLVFYCTLKIIRTSFKPEMYYFHMTLSSSISSTWPRVLIKMTRVCSLGVRSMSNRSWLLY